MDSSDDEDLIKAEEWQRAQVYEALDRLERGEEEHVPMEQVYETIRRALERLRRDSSAP